MKRHVKYFAINHVAVVDTNCIIVRDLRLLIFHLIRARSAKRNIKCAKLNMYSLRVLCKFVSVVKSAFPSERIYLSRAKDPSLDSHASLEDWFNSDVNVKIRYACREIDNFYEECDVGCVKFTDTFVTESHISRECKSAVFVTN